LRWEHLCPPFSELGLLQTDPLAFFRNLDPKLIGFENSLLTTHRKEGFRWDFLSQGECIAHANRFCPLLSGGQLLHALCNALALRFREPGMTALTARTCPFRKTGMLAAAAQAVIAAFRFPASEPLPSPVSGAASPRTALLLYEDGRAGDRLSQTFPPSRRPVPEA
jgi:hypothetical protein